MIQRSRITCPDCDRVWIAFTNDGSWRFPVHYPTDGQMCPFSEHIASEDLIEDDT